MRITKDEIVGDSYVTPQRPLYASRRAQIQQLFIFLSALLVVGATVFLGGKLIGGLSETACVAGDASFMRDIAETLDRYSSDGSRDIAVISPPCSALALCFVDSAAIGNPSFKGNDSVISASVHSGARENIFVQSKDKTVSVGYDERIILRAPNAPASMTDLCVEARSGDFRFRAQGFGRYVQLAGVAPRVP